ncbi:helix-turn-helix domain-containing protein [Streptomyces virginiae]|uniref:helix-turn-helix domain-containing protein n=1 Tax=Streptomyces virginiae TaxID=1961 RepID=UPI00068A8659|nr:XRE family transcriptional regulator [Streptomyces virginiae]
MVVDKGGDGGSPPFREQLAEAMRGMKEEARLSYGKLAEKTHYSRSSWERFLNGKQLPTTVAVEEFAAATGADADVLLTLLAKATAYEELRAARLQQAAAPHPAPEPAARPASTHTSSPAPVPATTTGPANVPATAHAPQAPSAAPARRPRLREWRGHARTAALVVAGALVGSIATVVIGGGPGGGAAADSSRAGAQPSGSAAAARASSPRPPACSADTCLRREPQAMDCQWDGTTVRETWLRGLKIQLRYSAACRAVWGRIENGTVGDSVTIKDKGGREESATIRVDNDTYTRMLAVSADAPPDSVIICGQIPRYQESECSPLGAVLP